MDTEKAQRQKINQPCVFSIPPQNSSPAVYSGNPVLGCDGETKKYVQELTLSIKKLQTILWIQERQSWQTKC